MRFPEIYVGLLNILLGGTPQLAAMETNKRTGVRITAMPGGASFSLDLGYGLLPTCGIRRTRPHIAAAELAWCVRGDNHVDWLRKHTRVWDAFADAHDCVPCDGHGHTPNGTGFPDTCAECDGTGQTYWLEASYGYRWRQKFGIDQLRIGIERLRADLTDRRVWISSWDPGCDILPLNQKTVPCPVGFTLSVMAGRLNSSLMIRSSDLLMGLPYDVMRHAYLMSTVANDLKVELGTMRVNLAHPHLYEPHWELAREAMRQVPVEPPMSLPTWALGAIENDPDGYVEAVKGYAALFQWPAYDPKIEVVR